MTSGSLKLLHISIVMLLIGIMSLIFLSLEITHPPKMQRLQDRNVLYAAKKGVVRYTIKNKGRFPCPDDNNDGTGDHYMSGCMTSIGWLPFKTLGIPELRDQHNQKLWYAYNPEQPLQVNGNIEALAVILAPHHALRHQKNRPSIASLHPSGAKKVIHYYLEGLNATSSPQVFSNLGPIDFNDELLWISHQDIKEASNVSQ